MSRSLRYDGIWRQGLALLAAGFVFAAALPAAEAPDAKESLRLAKALSSAYAQVVQKVMPSVVGIRRITKGKSTSRIFGTPQPGAPFNHNDMLRRFFERIPEQRTPPTEGYGSGVIIDTAGHILTNNHVVQGADKLVVEFRDDSHADAEIVGRDPKTDVAVIKLKKVERELVPAKLGNSDALQVGNIVLAIGSPFRFKHTVTKGIISGKNRHVGMAMYENFIQTDASINPGNSGGPLVNLDGEVIGINTVIQSRSGGSDGVGFAVPINMAREVMDQLVRSGKVTRGWLGVGINDVTPEMAAVMPGVEGGVAITEVYEGTPAYEGGVRQGDVIVEYNGVPPVDSRHLQTLVARTAPGAKVPVTVVRKGERVKLEVTVAKQPADVLASTRGEEPVEEPMKDETQSELLGLKVQNVNDRLRRLFDLPKKEKGVVVTKVLADSAAEEAGMGPGAFILEVDQKPTPDVAAFEAVANSLKGKKSALVLYRQDGHNRFSVLHF